MANRTVVVLLANNVELFKSIINLWARDFKVDEIRRRIQASLSKPFSVKAVKRPLRENHVCHERS